MKTLKTYERLAAGETPTPNRPGRPPLDPRWKRARMYEIARAWRKAGREAGWRTVWAMLRTVSKVSKWLVQRTLSELKRRWRLRKQRGLKARRTSVEVLARDALWSLDATHLGRLARRAIEAEVLRDPATRSSDVGRVGPPSDAQGVIDTLETLEATRGTLPLVLLTDRGSAYAAREVERYLDERQVVRLKSLPRTPQHNPWVERTNGELKARTGLGKGVRIESVELVAELLEVACATLNHRPRPCLGGRTPAWMDGRAPVGYDVVPRGRFYRMCREAVDRAVDGLTNARARWRAEREAILGTMERVGLIRRTPGGAR